MKKVFAAALMVSSLLLVSCGGGANGGFEAFSTVMVNAEPDVLRLESDVLTDNTCEAGTSTGGTFSTDLVPVTVTSTLYNGITAGSPVVIDQIEVEYTPRWSNSPAIPTQYYSSGAVVTAGGKKIIEVPVVTDVIKYNLTTVLQPVLLACSSTMAEYYVDIHLSAIEQQTGKRREIKTRMTAAVADRI